MTEAAAAPLSSRNPMRVLFFINGIYLGGKERRMIELMKEMKRSGLFDFELVVMNEEINYPDLIALDIKIHFLIRRSKKDLGIFKRFYRICKEFRPGIVHCWDGMTATYAIPACQLLHIRLVNGMVVDTPLKKNIFQKNWFRARMTFPFSDTIVGNSRSGLVAYKAPAGKSEHIYNGFNFARTRGLSPRSELLQELGIHGGYVVGMVATFSSLKDYPTYYAAAEIILQKRKDVTFLAIGSNTDSADSRRLLNNGMRESFRLLGKKSNIESYINLMDVCVLSTFTEGISNSILEYMALGKPVVATDGGGTCEIVSDGETGFLTAPSNPVQLAEKIELLLNDEKARSQMGEAGRLRVGRYFSIEAMSERFFSVYRKLYNSKNKASTHEPV